MKRTIISVVAGLILLIVTYFLSNLIMNSGDEIVAKAVTAEENVKVTNVKNSTNNATLSLNSIVQSENKLQLISEVTVKLGLSNGWFCPSIYCESFSKKGIQNDKYLEGVSETINNDLFFLWTGPKVISDFISQDHLKELGQVIKNPVVIWDNFYANDYCPTRLFLGDNYGQGFF